MNKHINFFAPFQRLSPGHENQLTRALLVVLRYSPMAHQSWLDLVDPCLRLHGLPRAEYVTQQEQIFTSKPDVPEGEAIRGISVWLAPDASLPSAPVKSSDRQQILDGIVSYGTDLVVVIENKVRRGTATEQPHQINLHDSPVKFSQEPSSVSWQHLLAVFSDLIARNLVYGAEAEVIDDFLSFVEEHFPEIGPYATLPRCGDQRYRLERRLDSILGEALGTNESPKLGGRVISGSAKLKMVFLGLTDEGSAVGLRLYPADTLGQARAFYADTKGVSAVLALLKDQWNVEPNLHWGYAATGLAWSNSPTTVEQYCTYWTERISTTREIERDAWDDYWKELCAAGIATESAKVEFDVDFTGSNRQRAQPRPGLACEYVWSLTEAKRLDEKGLFVKAVRTRVEQLLAAVGAG